jgi:hypothetical protein
MGSIGKLNSKKLFIHYMLLRPEIQSIKSKCEGENVFIIAGGPSLHGFDFSQLKGRPCIALNSAFKGIEEYLTAIYWTDNDWAAVNHDALMKFDGLKFNARTRGDIFFKDNIKGHAGATVLNRLGDFGFSFDINCVYGNNSGAHAINFLTNMKPYRILLLGYDMSFSQGRTHWHEGYTIANPTDRSYARVYPELFIPSINVMEPFIRQLGIDVVNCNPESKLECFRKDKLENYL